jgi:DNA polymerase
MQNELKNVVISIRKYIELEELAGTGEFLGRDRSLPDTTPDIETCPYTKSSSVVTLESVKKEAFLCTKCDLCTTRTHVVFGSGNPKAKLMFVGEAPGMQEDLQGLPFVGRAGKLLTKIIESIGLERKDAYIANILKCRPPDNRNPLPTEILTCEEYLIKQIELIKPAVICTLGKFASQTLLRTQETISRLRGRFFDYRGSKLIPTFHPAYLLRNPNEKRPVWEDMKKIRKELKRR